MGASGQQRYVLCVFFECYKIEGLALIVEWVDAQYFTVVRVCCLAMVIFFSLIKTSSFGFISPNIVGRR